MPTAIEVPTFRATLVTELTSRLGSVQVTRRHPGPLAESKGVYIGDATCRFTTDAVKTGRQRLKGTTVLPVILQTYRAGDDAAAIATVESDLWSMLAQLTDVIQDNTTLTQAVEWTEGIDVAEETARFERSWAARLTASITLHSRLT